MCDRLSIINLSVIKLILGFKDDIVIIIQLIIVIMIILRFFIIDFNLSVK
jgi:hypothetical protein